MEHKQGYGRMHAIVKKVYVRRLCRQIYPTDQVRVPDDRCNRTCTTARIPCMTRILYANFDILEIERTMGLIEFSVFSHFVSFMNI